MKYELPNKRQSFKAKRRVAGLMSDQDYVSVRTQLDAVTQAARSLGCKLHAPFGTLSFLSLSVIPELRITDRGVFDVMRQEIVAL